MRRLPAIDARYFQVIFQAIFLIYGLLFLGWQQNWDHFTLSIAGCLLFNYVAECFRLGKMLPLLGRDGFQRWGFSVLISAMSLCLLLKTNHWSVSLLACFFTVSSKYIFKLSSKHIFNPSAFGIVITIAITDAWLSPGQWGSNAIIFFFVITLGTIVVTRVQKLDVSLAFLVTFLGLLFWRQIVTLQWPMDHFFHSLSSGSLLLFSFFMISDPRTTPNHPFARILFAVLVAAISFYLTTFEWVNSAPIWVLVAAAPLVPMLDFLFRYKPFQWNLTPTSK